MQQDLLDVVISALGYFTNVYLVFDALDECDEEKVRSILLPLIERLASAKASIYLTSRQNPHDIQGQFGIANKIEIKPSDDDIRAYVNDVVTHSSRAKFVAQMDREDLISKLINCASGMYVTINILC
jgi:peroxiredoxin family protein